MLSVVCTGWVSAQGIDLGSFPKGKWLDANWNAVWEFGANSIRLPGPDGNVIYDFNGKVPGFKVEAGVSEVKVSFTCQDARRKYVFTKATTNLDLVMNIDPDWTDTNYSVTMKMQN